jgi:hypothetical protein
MEGSMFTTVATADVQTFDGSGFAWPVLGICFAMALFAIVVSFALDLLAVVARIAIELLWPQGRRPDPATLRRVRGR